MCGAEAPPTPSSFHLHVGGAGAGRGVQSGPDDRQIPTKKDIRRAYGTPDVLSYWKPGGIAPVVCDYLVGAGGGVGMAL